MPDSYDVAVIGAGSFGSWAAYLLRRTGRSVALLDAYGAGNGRASSGGESRIIRMGYGENDIYTRWSQHSLKLWTGLFAEADRPELFERTGVLWTPPLGDPSAAHTRAAFEKHGVSFQALTHSELEARFPQIRFSSPREGIFEPDSGVLLARRAVRAVVAQAIRNGVDYFREAALPPDGDTLRTVSGRVIRAGTFVYACGPWLPKIFPDVLEGRIRPTRQEVYFFGPPPGDARFAPPLMPAWLDFTDERGAYSLPDLENRGFKLAFDQHGPEFDPDLGERVVTGVREARAFLTERFPALATAPLVESRVCQYENTSTGDFLIDRHPDFDNVWLAGGGSGHGFKHGPMVGEYVTSQIEGSLAAEPRFSLITKAREAHRAVY
ncbi:MAG TPA: FAD-dependent oxidoreductase [Bryobacteraceae bacterium]|nr:FAD-dependent oxidoreductase [Bryobacteraceae bacterium]